VANPGTRILSVLLASAAVAWCAWRFIPGTPIDRSLVRLVSRTISKPPIAVSGNGSHASPWILLRPASTKPKSAISFPVVALGDDSEGIFQSSPPSPLDLAIVLKNMGRLGVSRAAIGAVLAWEDPDVIALSALDSAIDSFEKSATSAPLSRGPTASPLPPSFRRASISPVQARGNISDLPVVNRIPLPGIILGRENTLSGFTLLENEPEGFPVAARWDDRIVFAFPVVAAVVREGLSMDDIELVPGSHIKLGPAGPVIPIDRYGRMIASIEGGIAAKTVNAAALADTTEPLVAEPRKFALLRDDQSGAEPPTRRFSGSVAAGIEALSSTGSAPAAKIFRRAPASSELALLGAVCLAIAATSARPSRHRIHAIAGGSALVLQVILAVTASLWFVALPLLAATLAASVASRVFVREAKAVISPAKSAREPEEIPPSRVETKSKPEVSAATADAVAEKPVVVDPSSENLPPPAEIPAKKATAKKAASKTTAKKTARKAAAKKASGKKSGRSKK
jgi:hypothetical protein